jgi:hypothetical protein
MPHTALLSHPDRLLRLAQWLDLSGLSDTAAAARSAAEEMGAVVPSGDAAAGNRPACAWPIRALTGAEAVGTSASPEISEA